MLLEGKIRKFSKSTEGSHLSLVTILQSLKQICQSIFEVLYYICMNRQLKSIISDKR